MRRLARYLRRALLALAILIAILIAGLAVFSQTDTARELIRQQVVALLNQSMAGQFSIERLDGSLFREIRLHNVAIRYRDRDLLRAGSIAVDYSVADLIFRRINLRRIEIDQVEAHLERDEQGEWNLLAALAARNPAPAAGPSQLRLTIGNLVLQHASVEVVEGGKTYRIDPAQAEVYLSLDGPAIDARVRRFALQLSAPGFPAVAADGAIEYREAGAPASLTIPALTLTGGQSEIGIAGAINNLDTLDCDATITIDRLSASEIKRYVPRWAAQQNVSGTVKLRGPRHNLNASVNLLAAGGKITAQAKADLTGAAVNFGATLNVAGFDLGKAIEGGTLGGVVDANLKGQGAGASLNLVEGAADVKIRGPRVGGLQGRLVTIKGGLSRNVAKLTAGLSGGMGRANLSGRVDLGNAQSYDLVLSLEHLDLRKVAPGQQPVDTNLNLRAKLSGAGFDFTKAKARADLKFLPSAIGRVQLARGTIGATISGRRVRGHASLSADTAELEADGDLNLAAGLNLAADHRLRATYKVHVADLAPWAALAGVQGGGSLDLSGGIAGSLDHIHAQGDALFAALSYGTNYVGCGSASADLSDVGKPAMHGSVAVSMKEVESTIRLKTLTVTASLAQLRPVTIASLSIKARDQQSLSDEIDAGIRITPAKQELTLTRVSIQDSRETWSNPVPARLVADANGVEIDKFELASGSTQILLDGRAGQSGAQDMRLRIDAFPLSVLNEALPQKIDLKGSLSVATHVTGTAAAPVIHATSSITALAVGGQSYQGLDLSAGYDGRQASLDLTFKQDREHALTASGKVPLALSWATGFVIKPQGDLDFRAFSSGLSLVFLDAAAGGALRNVKGLLTVNLIVTGPLAAPVPVGTIAIQGGAVTIAPLGVKIDTLELSTDFTPDRVRLAQLHIVSGQGTIIGNGQLGLEKYQPGSVEVAIHLSQWPAIASRQYRATVNGQIDVAGTANAPQVTGNIEVVNALLRPDLGFLSSSPPPPDPTIRFVSSAPSSTPELESIKTGKLDEYACGRPRKPPPKPNAQPAEQTINAAHGLGLDVKVRLRRDIWIKEEKGSAELTGDLRVAKSSNGPIGAVGEIDTVRGWMTVMGKIFTVSSAKVTFTGGSPIDPALDVTADYQAPQYVVHVIIGGTASAPTLTLKSDPSLEQADILSVLMFGKPAGQLSGGEQSDLKSKAAELATGYAASEAGRQLSQALGLEEMGIEFRQTASGVGVGSYLGANTYATFSQDLTQQGGQRIDLNHYLTRHWQINTNTTSSGDRGADLIWSTSY